jgi:hypothetical protein
MPANIGATNNSNTWVAYEIELSTLIFPKKACQVANLIPTLFYCFIFAILLVPKTND